MYDISNLKHIYEKHAPFVVSVDYSDLPHNKKKILDRFCKIADIIDGIYWKQISPDSLTFREKYKLPHNEDERLIHELIEINCGAYDRLNYYEPFLEDRKRFPGGGFYPEDITKEELSSYIASHPKEKELLESPYTVLKRDGNKLRPFWYHDEYKAETQEIFRLLNESASLSDNDSLKRFLIKKSQDLLKDDYYESDCAWLSLDDEHLDFVVGPCEVYTDNLLGIKTSHRAIVMLVNQAESAKLNKYKNLISTFEDILPIPEKYKGKSNANLDTHMIFVDCVYRGGESRRAMQSVAFSLPNDPRVLMEKGSKKVLQKNFLEGRFNTIIVPSAKQVLNSQYHCYLGANEFVQHVVMHEIAHTLGPRLVYATNKSINSSLKELYSPLEELRADILAVYLLERLIESNDANDISLEALYTSFLAESVRWVRIGHGAYSVNSTIMFNYFLENGGVSWDGNKLDIVIHNMPKCVRGLSEEVSTIEAEGDYERAQKLVDKYNIKSSLIKYMLDGIAFEKVDIWPTYKLTGGNL